MEDRSKKLPSPAEFIRDQLDARGMTQLDLAFVLGVNQQAVSQLALGRRGVSAEMAKALGQAFDFSAKEILRMQKASEVEPELSRARDPDPSIARKARLTKSVPIREMVKRGWLDNEQDTLEEQLARFFGTSSIEEIPLFGHAAKKTSYAEPMPPAQLAWLFRVRQIASRLVVSTYSERALRDALPKLRALMGRPDDASKVPRLLTECGVRFVVVENLPGAKIDGVCFWLDGGTSPVIAMTTRFDRIDNFWFVLRHEIEHVFNRDGITSIRVDADFAADGGDRSDDLPQEELAANAAASDFMVPAAKMDSWIARKGPFFREADLLGFAKLQQVHPGIVAGQLRHRRGDHRLFTQHLVKIRQELLATAAVDGWGDVYPIK